MYPNGYVSLYSMYDSYTHKAGDSPSIYSPTYFHMGELLIIYICYMLARHYPEEFNLKLELFCSLVLNFVFNIQVEISALIYAQKEHHHLDVCIFSIWHYNVVGDAFRLIGFISLLYYLTRKSNDYFPLPFTWIFKDLSKFIFEPTCINVFRQYLLAKEPDGRIG